MERQETKVWLLMPLGLSLERGAASMVGRLLHYCSIIINHNWFAFREY
jgi:hypothetical protein